MVLLAPYEIDGAGGWWARQLAQSTDWRRDEARPLTDHDIELIAREFFPQSVRVGGEKFLACALEAARASLAPRGFVTTWFAYLPGEWRRRRAAAPETLWARWEWVRLNLLGAEFPRLAAGRPRADVEAFHVDDPPPGFPLEKGRYLLRADESVGVEVRRLDSLEDEVWEGLEEGLVEAALPREWRDVYREFVQQGWVTGPEGGS